MVTAVPDILAQIVAHTKTQLKPVTEAMEKRAEESMRARRSFANALTTGRPGIIAEVKKASPSRGLLVEDFSAPDIARAYEAGGAAAISVLTDQKFFQGSLGDLEAVRDAVQVPLLRKDFTIDNSQILEAAVYGADAILLIAALLDETQLRNFRETAARYRLDALVEVHDRDELKRAVDSGAEIIGVNNRDLRTFTVDVQRSVELSEWMPTQSIRVAESGIQSSADVRLLWGAGYQGFLAGEHLMRSGDSASSLRALLQ